MLYKVLYPEAGGRAGIVFVERIGKSSSVEFTWGVKAPDFFDAAMDARVTTRKTKTGGTDVFVSHPSQSTRWMGFPAHLLDY